MKHFISEIRENEQGIEGTVFHRHLRGSPGTFSDVPSWVPGEIASRLSRRGIDRLFSHQLEALHLIRSGGNVVVSTPTASGKSLIYNLMSAASVQADPHSRALYLFPLKALEQDQVRALEETFGGMLLPAIYDGDTPTSRRTKIRKNPPHVLVTNPDMLHAGILPYHSSWTGFWPGLKYVIVDELHTYRGIFGSHVAQVLRRLRRVAESYGSSPQFLCFSATIGNPGELAESLVGLPFRVINESGAPRSGRHFLFFNPSASPYASAARMFSRAVELGYRTIAFTRARKITELVYQWVCEGHPEWEGKIASYRAGYLPEERREIEQGLFEGRVLGVIATSALELGIDIGNLEVGILVGYPGTIATTWQRSGRVGRRIAPPGAPGGTAGPESLVVMIATSDALDQFFMEDPGEFFRRSPEAAVTDPGNPVVLRSHLACAAAEKPLAVSGDPMRPDFFPELMTEMELAGELLRDAAGSRWFSPRRYPQREVSLRSAGEEFVIRSLDDELIGRIDEARVTSECHPGAIYLHRGKQYRGEQIDFARKTVRVRPVEAEYYTVPAKDEEVEIIEVEERVTRGGVDFGRGQVRVTERITGYEQKRFSGERIAEFPLELPESVFTTEGFWLEIPSRLADRIASERRDLSGAVHAVEHAAIAVFPLFVLCDRNDLGGVSYPYHHQLKGPAIFIYDGYPGGVGICRRGYEEAVSLLTAVRDLIRRCGCEAGCPSCIQSPRCGSGNRPLDKAGGFLLVQGLRRAAARRKDTVRPGEKRVAPVPPRPRREICPGTPEAETNASPAKPGRIMFFDIETQRSAAEVGGWERADAMGLSIGVVWDSQAKRYREFREENADGLALTLKRADLVVGFNIIGFDYRVLSAYGAFSEWDPPTLDILADLKAIVGIRISLNNLARSTLGKEKTGDGLKALALYREGNWEELAGYCRQDVALVRELFEFGLKYGYLLLEKRDELIRAPVEWKGRLRRMGISYDN